MYNDLDSLIEKADELKEEIIQDNIIYGDVNQDKLDKIVELYKTIVGNIDNQIKDRMH